MIPINMSTNTWTYFYVDPSGASSCSYLDDNRTSSFILHLLLTGNMCSVYRKRVFCLLETCVLFTGNVICVNVIANADSCLRVDSY